MTPSRGNANDLHSLYIAELMKGVIKLMGKNGKGRDLNDFMPQKRRFPYVFGAQTNASSLRVEVLIGVL
jgi:hypothetical protein